MLENALKTFVVYKIEEELAETNNFLMQIDNKIMQGKLQLYEDKIYRDIENNIGCITDCEPDVSTTASKNESSILSAKYQQILVKLEKDLLIFFVCNSIIFLAILLLVLVRPKHTTQIYLPCALIVTATILSIIIYICGQNWFYSIIYNNYVGYSYLAYVCLISAQILDIALNRGRITAEILNVLSGVFGKIASSL